MLTDVKKLVSAKASIHLCAALTALLLAGHVEAANETSIAVLEFELIKSDLAGPATDAESARMARTAEQLRAGLRDAGYAVIAAAESQAASEQASRGQYLHACNGCERTIAKSLSADWVVVGWVQIVSNLIINLNVVVSDVQSGAGVAKAFVDLRGNNDKSWQRATRFLLNEILLERLAKRANQN